MRITSVPIPSVLRVELTLDVRLSTPPCGLDKRDLIRQIPIFRVDQEYQALCFSRFGRSLVGWFLAKVSTGVCRSSSSRPKDGGVGG